MKKIVSQLMTATCCLFVSFSASADFQWNQKDPPPDPVVLEEENGVDVDIDALRKKGEYSSSLAAKERMVATTKVSDLNVWEIKKGSLRTQLENWIKKAGYQSVEWSLSGDYDITSGSTFNGSLSQALEQLGDTLRLNGTPIYFEEFGNKVVRIQEVK